jgi:hypothetical protein
MQELKLRKQIVRRLFAFQMDSTKGSLNTPTSFMGKNALQQKTADK